MKSCAILLAALQPPAQSVTAVRTVDFRKVRGFLSEVSAKSREERDCALPRAEITRLKKDCLNEPIYYRKQSEIMGTNPNEPKKRTHFDSIKPFHIKQLQRFLERSHASD